MSETELLPMHPDFARWHASIELGDDESTRQARWAGVSAVAQTPNTKSIEALVRLTFKSRQPAIAAEVQKIRETFKTADATFEMQGNEHELQVLAAASLAVLMSNGGEYGGEAALAITTASMEKTRKPDLPMDLLVLAESAIDHIAELTRKRPNFTDKTSENLITKLIEEAVDVGTTGEALTQMAKSQAKTKLAMNGFLKIQDEELQMLWWLMGQRSLDLDCTFDTVPAGAKPLVLGKELADCTGYLPGPASVKALLSRAGLKDNEKIALTAAINETDETWLQIFMPEGEVSPVSTPIHFGIKRRLDTGSGDAWILAWAGAVGVPDNFIVSPLTLGLLFYRERLLLRFSGE